MVKNRFPRQSGRPERPRRASRLSGFTAREAVSGWHKPSIFLIRAMIVVAALLFIGGCAAQKPVLYPNAHLEEVGQQQAQADIEQCMEMARSHGVKDNAEGKAARDTARNAAVGAAAGAAVSAVWGGNVGRSAAAGGAGAAAGTAAARMFDPGGPDPVFQGFVNQCLRDKGYQVAGWQ